MTGRVLCGFLVQEHWQCLERRLEISERRSASVL